MKVEEGNRLFNLLINRQVIPDQSVLRELQQLLVYFNTVCTCVRCVSVSRVCVCEREREKYFVIRTSWEEVNSMEGNEETAGCGMLIQ